MFTEKDTSVITIERTHKILQAGGAAKLARQEEEKKIQPYKINPLQIKELKSIQEYKLQAAWLLLLLSHSVMHHPVYFALV